MLQEFVCRAPVVGWTLPVFLDSRCRISDIERRKKGIVRERVVRLSAPILVPPRHDSLRTMFAGWIGYLNELQKGIGRRNGGISIIWRERYSAASGSRGLSSPLRTWRWCGRLNLTPTLHPAYFTHIPLQGNHFVALHHQKSYRIVS